MNRTLDELDFSREVRVPREQTSYVRSRARSDAHRGVTHAPHAACALRLEVSESVRPAGGHGLFKSTEARARDTRGRASEEEAWGR